MKNSTMLIGIGVGSVAGVCVSIAFALLVGAFQAARNNVTLTTVQPTVSTTSVLNTSSNGAVASSSNGIGNPFPAEYRVECQSATPVIDIEGNTSGARKDSTHVLDESCRPLPGANPNTFVALDVFYGKDANNVYIIADLSENGGPSMSRIVGADPATFTLIPDAANESLNLYPMEGFSNVYTKDKSHVYAYGKIVAGADPAAFVIHDPTKKLYCESDAQDHFSVYYQGRLLKVASPPASN